MPERRSRSVRLFTSLVLIAVVSVFVVVWGAHPPRRGSTPMLNGFIGTAAPDFSLPLLDGGEVKLADLKGHVVVLDFWAVWCPPCVEELPLTTEITARYAKQGVKFYAINLTESAAAVRAFLAKKQLATSVALAAGTDIGERYGVEYIPQTVVIDRDGIIRHLDTIAPSDLPDLLPKWIESTLKDGQPVARG